MKWLDFIRAHRPEPQKHRCSVTYLPGGNMAGCRWQSMCQVCYSWVPHCTWSDAMAWADEHTRRKLSEK